METLVLRRWTGLFLMIIPILFTISFTLLQIQFNYPDILRQPTTVILEKMNTGGRSLHVVWYLMTFSALMFIPIAILVHRVIAHPSSLLWIGTVFGVIAGVVQALGFLRWTFVVPHLAAAFVAPTTSSMQREAIAITFDAFHRYAGMGLGEHLGFICTAVWTACVAWELRQTGVIKRWLGMIGMGLALGVAMGIFEPLGWTWAGVVNAVGYLMWAVWLVIIGVIITGRMGEACLSHTAE